MIYYILLIIAMVAIDQASKMLVEQDLFHKSMTIIPGIFDFTYVQNRGAAFGIFQNKQYIFAAIAIIVIVIGILFILKNKSKKIINFAVCMIIGGAIGNSIDRMNLGYVVDFIDFRFIWSYVFNIADIFVVLGTIILCIAMLLEERVKSE